MIWTLHFAILTGWQYFSIRREKESLQPAGDWMRSALIHACFPLSCCSNLCDASISCKRERAEGHRNQTSGFYPLHRQPFHSPGRKQRWLGRYVTSTSFTLAAGNYSHLGDQRMSALGRPSLVVMVTVKGLAEQMFFDRFKLYSNAEEMSHF